MKIIYLCYISFLMLIALHCGQGRPISMVDGTASTTTLPYGVFNGETWKADPEAQFVKLHSYFDEALTVSKIEVAMCGAMEHEVAMFINFDEIELPLKPSAKIVHNFGSPVVVRSVTINMGRNKSVCVNDFGIYDENGKRIKFRTPKIVDGEVTASSQLKPLEAYQPMFLFDSRFHYAYSADGFPGEGVRLNFTFREKQKIEQIKIWNGFQMSLLLCLNNARAKTMVVRGDGGYEEKLQVADAMGGQVLKLPRPYEGTKLELHITEVYKGWFYKDLVISELRFFNGKEWLIINPLPALQKTIGYFKDTFRKASVEGVLNRSLVPLEAEPSEFTMRLRGDGSFYFDAIARDYVAEGEKTSKYSALGMYEVKESTPAHVKIRVFGTYRMRAEVSDFPLGGDCNGCGSDCNKLQFGGKDSTQKERIFQEFFTLKKTDAGYFLEDYSPTAQFGFRELPLRLE
ncbi:MAG: NADase-type glycan-binding domain-containing protein [Spirochaetota bacterium]